MRPQDVGDEASQLRRLRVRGIIGEILDDVREAVARNPRRTKPVAYEFFNSWPIEEVIDSLRSAGWRVIIQEYGHWRRLFEMYDGRLLISGWESKVRS